MSDKNVVVPPSMRAFALAYGEALRRLRSVPDAIRSALVYPPLPVRVFDWHAFRDPEGPVGMGATEHEAVDDLLMQEQASFGTAYDESQRPF